MALRRDAIARGELVAARRDMHPQAARLIACREARKRLVLDDDAPASLDDVDIDDPAVDGDRAKAPLQHRRLALPGGFPHPGKAGGEQGQASAASHQAELRRSARARAAAGECRRTARPQRRLDLQQEIDADAGAEEYR